MASSDSPSPRPVTVSGTPIELCQFLKFAGLAASGGQAKQAISEGKVLLNGVVETRKRKKLVEGDIVQFSSESIIVAC
jgi:ribosome-associated protein